MTRLASVSLSCIVALLAVLPSALAGPACATKNYRQQQCIERCKAKWGYPGSLMGGDRWGSVMRKVADKSTEAMDAAISQACGFGTSSAAPQGAVAGATESTTSTSSHTSSTETLVQSSTPFPSTSATTSSSASSSSSTSSSSTSSSSSSLTSTTGANLFDGYVPSSTNTPTTTSTTSTPTSTSTTEESTPTSEPPPPPPPTSTTSTPESTPTDSENSGNSGSGNDEGNKDQGSSDSSGNSNSGSSGSSGNSGATSSGDIQAYLSAHNSIRAQHGASDLTWSDDAASKAQQWANNCVFEHSGGKLGPFGENLAAGTGSSYGISEAIKSWTDEVSEYQSSNPQPSHFTQVVWKGTTQVGCAVTSCDGIFDASFGKAKYFVCEYFPQGNIIGKFGDNVQA